MARKKKDKGVVDKTVDKNKEWDYDHNAELTPEGAGRPTIMTKIMVDKLIQCFSLGYTDDQACFHCNIDKQTLYNYCKKYPNFSTKKEELKQKPSLKAKNVVINAINSGDVTTARWYLERKNKDEFSVRNEITGKDGNAIESVSFTPDELRDWYDEMRGEDE